MALSVIWLELLSLKMLMMGPVHDYLALSLRQLFNPKVHLNR
jgi:hypothetical protein